MTKTSEALSIDCDHQDDYQQYIARLSTGFIGTFERNPLFTTDANLWPAYLAAFHDDQRQYHNCHACRRFVENYGGLVTIDPTGQIHSALWETEPTGELTASVNAMRAIVERANVTGVFVTSEPMLGTYESGLREKGNTNSPLWNHLSVTVPVKKRHDGKVLTAHQAACEKLCDFENVTRALGEFREDILAQTVSLLTNDALYRSEKVLGPAVWLYELSARWNVERNHKTKRNLVFHAIAEAPAGFCHPRSSMIGTLLDDIATGNGFEWAAARFRSKMHPLQYQRPTAAPSAGQIDAAEKLVEKLGIARSLERRYARLDEVVTIWKPKEAVKQSGGVFAQLRNEVKTKPLGLVVPSTRITWVKFAASVLPTATRIEINAPNSGAYCCYVTAAHADAPPILQWDTDENRNPVSWHLKHPTGYAQYFGVKQGWNDVVAIAPKPSMLHGKCEHHGNGQLFVIAGCVESENRTSVIFPETLKSELHGVRSVVEAHSNRTPLAGKAEASAGGIIFMGTGRTIELRVTDTFGVVTGYILDRWD